jgi:hypothetical protein
LRMQLQRICDHVVDATSGIINGCHVTFLRAPPARFSLGVPSDNVMHAKAPPDLIIDVQYWYRHGA